MVDKSCHPSFKCKRAVLLYSIFIVFPNFSLVVFLLHPFPFLYSLIMSLWSPNSNVVVQMQLSTICLSLSVEWQCWRQSSSYCILQLFFLLCGADLQVFKYLSTVKCRVKVSGLSRTLAEAWPSWNIKILKALTACKEPSSVVWQLLPFPPFRSSIGSISTVAVLLVVCVLLCFF